MADLQTFLVLGHRFSQECIGQQQGVSFHFSFHPSLAPFDLGLQRVEECECNALFGGPRSSSYLLQLSQLREPLFVTGSSNSEKGQRPVVAAGSHSDKRTRRTRGKQDEVVREDSGSGIVISGIVGNCRELSGIVRNCRELSGIVENCRELSGKSRQKQTLVRNGQKGSTFPESKGCT